MINKIGMLVLLSALAETQGNGNAPADEENTASDNVIAEKDGITYVRQEFKVSRGGGATPITGWGFAVPSFNSVEQMVEHYNEKCKEQGKEDIDGNKLVLDLAQSALEAKLRIRVKASTPGVGDAGFKTENDLVNFFEGKEKENPDKLLFSVEEAANWIPGVRELSKAKQREQKMLQIKELIAAKDKELGVGNAIKTPEVQALLMELATKYL